MSRGGVKKRQSSSGRKGNVVFVDSLYDVDNSHDVNDFNDVDSSHDVNAYNDVDSSHESFNLFTYVAVSESFNLFTYSAVFTTLWEDDWRNLNTL